MIWRSLVILILVPTLAYSQSGIPIGTWRTHFGYRDAHSLALTPEGLYCAGNNTLFFLSFDDNSITPLTKIDGLSRNDISIIGYNSNSETLVIAYNQGTLDLLQNNTITEISAIADAGNTLPKQIKHIQSQDQNAYVSGSFGVALLDLVQQEIPEAYVNIGANGGVLDVEASTIFQDSIFLASAEGVIAASLDPQINLLDYTNWRRFGAAENLIEDAFHAITTFNNRVYAARNFDGIYVYQGSSWRRLDYNLAGQISSASSSSTVLNLSASGKIVQIDTDENIQELDIALSSSPQATVSAPGNLWIADSLNGLVNLTETSIYPNGPYSDSLARIEILNDQVVSFAPAFDRFRRPLNSFLGINSFAENSWTAFNNSGDIGTVSFPAVANLLQGTYADNHTFYFASFGSGILAWDSDGNTSLLDDNSPGSTLIRNSLGQVLVSSVLADDQGILWSTNYGNSLVLHRFDPSANTWQAFATPFIAARFPLDLKGTDEGDLWLRLDPNNGGGVWVINPESGQQRLLTTNQNEGGLPTSAINDLEIDLEGQVWLATDRGVAVYPFPFDILERSDVNSSSVFIDGRPLLRDERVTAIAVDGGNRKWMGTDNGLWLFSALGDSVIFNFTAENSPLPSNVIIDIAIDPNSGEVFILTDIGLVSFRSTATTGTRVHQQVKIFPNPVDPGFNGLVGISGLTTNAIIKITDVSGKLVTELRAEGGSATWNVADYRGNRVSAGVYLVFSSSTDGEETFVGKIAVFN